MKDGLIHIGKIVNTHGLKGEVKVKSFTDFKSQRYSKTNDTYIFFQEAYYPVRIKSFRTHQGFDYLVFMNHEDINLVERFKGCDLFAENTTPTGLKANEYLPSDLIGLSVSQGENLVGTVCDIRTYPQGDYLEVVDNNNKKSLIPFRNPFIISVNLDDKTIHIVEMEGLV